MGTVLFKVLEMSLSGGIAILAVLLLRLIFRKFPKKLLILFWLVVAFRLVIPFNLSSPTSAQNIAQLFSRNETEVVENLEDEDSASVKDKVTSEAVTTSETKSFEEDHNFKRVINANVTVKMGEKASPTVSVKGVLAAIWLSVAIGLFVFFLVRYFRFYDKARWCSRSYDGRYFMTEIESPFVIGFLSPKIFVPIRMDEDEREYILNHEWTHIKNKDGLTKLICYFILCIHWFNPLVWLAYVMLCADMEMRVDEETTSSFDVELIKEYCMSIVLHATGANKSTSFMQGTAFSGLGFGGMEAKLRVANLLNNKKISKTLQIIVLVFAISFSFLVSTASYDFNGSEVSEKKIEKISKSNETTEIKSQITELDNRMFDVYAKKVEEVVKSNNAIKDDLLFELVYIDEDNVPELIISKPGYYVDAYSYSNGEANHIMEFWPYGAGGNFGYEYIPYKNVIYNSDSEYSGSLKWISIYKLDDEHKKVVSAYDETLNLRYYDSAPDEIYPDDFDSVTKLDTPRYYMGTTELTEDEFYSYIPEGDYKKLGKGTDYESFMKAMSNKEFPTYPPYYILAAYNNNTWEEASDYAEIQCADLASIDTPEKWAKVTSKIRENNYTDVIFYVGAKRDDDGVMRWLSGEEVDSRYWLSGEPSGTGPTDDGRTVDEPYVALFYKESDNRFYLMDVPNDMLDAASCYKDHIGYICELEY